MSDRAWMNKSFNVFAAMIFSKVLRKVASLLGCDALLGRKLLRHLQVLFNRWQGLLSSLFEVCVLAAAGLGLKGCYGLLVPVESDLLDIGGVERFAMKAA